MEIIKVFDPTNKKTWSICKTTDNEELYVLMTEGEMKVKWSLESAIFTIISEISKKTE